MCILCVNSISRGDLDITSLFSITRFLQASTDDWRDRPCSRQQEPNTRPSTDHTYNAPTLYRQEWSYNETQGSQIQPWSVNPISFHRKKLDISASDFLFKTLREADNCMILQMYNNTKQKLVRFYFFTADFVWKH